MSTAACRGKPDEVCEAVCDRVIVPDDVTLSVAATLSVCERLAVAVPLIERVWEADWVSVGVRVEDKLGVCVTDGERDSDGDPDCETVEICVIEGVCDTLEEPEGDAVTLLLGVDDCDADGVSLEVSVDDELGDCVAEGVSDPEGDPD